jgi:DNA helicase HerA-like ATPase
VLSQCGTIICMRLNNERDQAFVKSAMPEGARGFLDVIPALRNRECIVCGEGVSIPIRVSFDDLERDRCPASSDPTFSELWKQCGDEEAMVTRVVKRWRASGALIGLFWRHPSVRDLLRQHPVPVRSAQ